MPVYKVWSFDRSLKKSVFLLSHDLPLLIEKGKKRLSIAEDAVCVLETDGTEIEDSDVLEHYSGEALLLLAGQQKWTPADLPSTAYTVSSPSPSPAGVGSTLDTTPACLSSPTPSVTMTESSDSQSSSSSQQPAAVMSPARLVRAEGLPPPGKLEIPELSLGLKLALDNGDLSVLNRVLTEVSSFYFQKYPDMKDSAYYQEVGKKLVKTYPCLAMEGTKPWQFLVMKLSARMRSLRNQQKSKSLRASEPTDLTASSPAAKRFKLQDRRMDLDLSHVLSEKEYDDHLQELKEEWEKAKPSKSHIHLLLNQLRENRKKWMTDLPGGKIKPIIDAFPCFEEGQFVLHELFSSLDQKDPEKARQDICFNMEWLLKFVANTMKSKEDISELILLQALEKAVAVDKGNSKTQKSRTVFTTHKIDDVTSIPEKLLTTKECTSPKLVAFFSSEDVYQTSYVVGDGVKVLTQTPNLLDAVVLLIATYYVFDLSYPPVFAPFLGLLQKFVIKDPYTGHKGTKWTTFVKKLSLASK